MSMALSSIGVFLLFYRGYDGKDRIASAVAGFSAIIVSQLPCGLCRAPAAVNADLWGWESWYGEPFGAEHYGAAAIMFAALAYFCFALFPQTDKGSDPGDRAIKGESFPPLNDRSKAGAGDAACSQPVAGQG